MNQGSVRALCKGASLHWLGISFTTSNTQSLVCKRCSILEVFKWSLSTGTNIYRGFNGFIIVSGDGSTEGWSAHKGPNGVRPHPLSIWQYSQWLQSFLICFMAHSDVYGCYGVKMKALMDVKGRGSIQQGAAFNQGSLCVKSIIHLLTVSAKNTLLLQGRWWLRCTHFIHWDTKKTKSTHTRSVALNVLTMF